MGGKIKRQLCSMYETDHSPSTVCPRPFGTARARTAAMAECRMADFALGSFVRVASTPPPCCDGDSPIPGVSVKASSDANAVSGQDKMAP